MQIEGVRKGQRLRPLDRLTLNGVGDHAVSVRDAMGREYARLSVGESGFRIGGALGTHRAVSLDSEGHELASVTFQVDDQTRIEDAGGRFNELLSMLHFTMISEFGEAQSCLWNGRIYHYFICWLRDHVHVLKGMKYFSPQIKTGIELYRDSQREDGMIWDNCYPRGADPNYWQVRFTEGDFYRAFEDHTFEFKRIPAENDVEYLFVEGIYYTWKATGDDAWMAECLDPAKRALEYSVTDEYRWSEALGLLKRGYTIDTWDFQVAGEGIEGDVMRVRPGQTNFGAMFGDTTGYVAACRQLAEMLEAVGRADEAPPYLERAERLAKRLEEVSWRGTHFQHHVPEDPSVKRDLGVDETRQVSLSNAYSLNRGIDPEMARAIVQTYQRIKGELPVGSPGEWYTIYPPFERGFGGHSDQWQYMNASVTPIVAGELARGAFEHGAESYGVDILDRLIDLGRRHENRFHCSYTGSLPTAPDRDYAPVDLTSYANFDVHGPGGDGVPGWANSPNDLRELPVGAQTFASVPFLVTDPESNGRRGAVAVQEVIDIPVGRTVGSLYFFHTMSGSGSGIAGTVRLRYADGTEYARDVLRDRDVLGWWMPELPKQHGRRTLDLGWKGKNEVLPYVGVSVWGMDNPHPDREIARVTLEPPREEGAAWYVMGLTLSDQEAWFPTDPISFGIPNGWGAAAVVYALIEGLAGVVDASTAYDEVRLSPRWSAARVNAAEAVVHYPASGGYVKYRYRESSDAIELEVTGSGSKAHCSVLLPPGASANGVQVDGHPAELRCRGTASSTYVDFEVALPGPLDVRIEVERAI